MSFDPIAVVVDAYRQRLQHKTEPELRAELKDAEESDQSGADLAVELIRDELKYRGLELC